MTIKKSEIYRKQRAFRHSLPDELPQGTVIVVLEKEIQISGGRGVIVLNFNTNRFDGWVSFRFYKDTVSADLMSESLEGFTPVSDRAATECLLRMITGAFDGD